MKVLSTEYNFTYQTMVRKITAA